MAQGLSVRGVCKSYPIPGEPLEVLRGVDLQLAPGGTVAIVGPSGSGKSTLLNILGTLDVPTAGRVELDGCDVLALRGEALARFRAAHIGFVFQEHHLLPQCTALENVLVARLAAGPVRAEDMARGRELLASVGLAERLGHLPGELSGGERQRVAIARALMNRPRLVLCDEPTGNLDAHAAEAVGRLLTDRVTAEGAMLIVVTHSTMIAGMVGRRLRMDAGRLAEEEAEDGAGGGRGGGR